MTTYVLAKTQRSFLEILDQNDLDPLTTVWLNTGTRGVSARRLRGRRLRPEDRVIEHPGASRGHAHGETRDLVRQLQAELWDRLAGTDPVDESA